MNRIVSCTCGDVIVKSLDASTKVRAKVIVFRGDNAYAICKSCDADVRIPLLLDADLLKSMSDSKEVRLYIRETSKKT